MSKTQLIALLGLLDMNKFTKAHLTFVRFMKTEASLIPDGWWAGGERVDYTLYSNDPPSLEEITRIITENKHQLLKVGFDMSDFKGMEIDLLFRSVKYRGGVELLPPHSVIKERTGIVLSRIDYGSGGGVIIE